VLIRPIGLFGLSVNRLGSNPESAVLLSSCYSLPKPVPPAIQRPHHIPYRYSEMMFELAHLKIIPFIILVRLLLGALGAINNAKSEGKRYPRTGIKWAIVLFIRSAKMSMKVSLTPVNYVDFSLSSSFARSSRLWPSSVPPTRGMSRDREGGSYDPCHPAF
jgi:hypothetical protein